MKNLFITFFILAFYTNVQSQDVSGDWSGSVQVGQTEQIIFVFHIKNQEDNYSTTIDIPTKRVTGLAPRETIFKNDELIVDASNLGFRYLGKFYRSSMEIDGSFTEGATKLPLVLKHKEIKQQPGYNRPQEPARPYPYKEEEVTFKNTEAGVTLAGTFTRPTVTGKVPVVVLITGSGPQDRDETFATHKTFLVLSDYLTRQGLAVLRYDDRGAGKSTGNHSAATTKDLASDVICAIEYLKSRDDIDKNKIGLIGHSEGGIIAPMVANRSKGVSFIVSLAGTGISGSEISLIHAKTMRGFPVPDEAYYEQAIRKAIAIASSDKDLSVIREELLMHYTSTIAPILRPMLGSEAKVNEVINGLIDARTTTWMRYFYNYNPAVEFEKVKCPVLSLNGDKDVQVPSKINQGGIQKALEKGGNKDYLVKELPGLNHLFQECKTGALGEYSQIEQTFSPDALQQLSEWILAHSR